MKEFAKQFIGEECIIYTINEGNIVGTIKEINYGGMIIDKKSGEREVVNLDFVFVSVNIPETKTARKEYCIRLSVDKY